MIDLYEKAEKYYKKKYPVIVNELHTLLLQQDEAGFLEAFKQLPTDKELFDSLITKLSGKSVYKTLVKIQEGSVGRFTTIKGLSSLLTHTCIELEKGNTEYELLLPMLYEKLSKAFFL